MKEESDLDRALAASLETAGVKEEKPGPKDDVPMESDSKQSASSAKKVEPKPKVSQTETIEKITTQLAELRSKYLAEGPFVYELQAVMLHKGGAYGGHYNAYIKDTEAEGEQWYLFNDTHVTKVTMPDLYTAFGGNHNLPCAYMLVYRLITTEPAGPKASIDDIPEEVKHDVIERLQT